MIIRNMRPLPCLAWLALCVIVGLITHLISLHPSFPSTSCSTGFLRCDLAFIIFVSVTRILSTLRNSLNLNNYVLIAAAMAGILNAHLGLFPASSCALLTWYLFSKAVAFFRLRVPNPWY